MSRNKDEIIALLGRAFEGGNADDLKPYLHDDCRYASDYAQVHHRTAEHIIAALKAVAENVNNSVEDCSYTCEVVELSAVLKEGILLSDLRKDSCFEVYERGLLMFQYHAVEPVAVVFVKFNFGEQIVEINLSRSTKWFELVFYDDENDSARDTPYTVQPMTPGDIFDRRISRQLRGTGYINRYVDDGDEYIWKQADRLFCSWLEDYGYEVWEIDVFYDCVGYHCRRNGIVYTIYMFAADAESEIEIDASYFLEISELTFSRNFVLIACLKVGLNRTDEGNEYYIGSWADVEDPVIELWHPHNIMGEDVLVYFPRKEVYDVFDRFMYAFNNERIDAFELLIAEDNPEFWTVNKEHFTDEGFYLELHRIRQKYGKMKCGYLSVDGIVYDQIAYIHDYGWFTFKTDEKERIYELRAYPFDDRVVDFLQAEEDVPDHIYADVPRAVSIEVLPSAIGGRFSVVVNYDNGERKKYALPISEQDENNAVVRYGRYSLTDLKWNTARLVEKYSKISGYPDGGQAIQLEDGFCISALKCYEYGEKYWISEMLGDIVFENDDFMLKALWQYGDTYIHWDDETGVLIASCTDFAQSRAHFLVNLKGERITSVNYRKLEDSSEGLFTASPDGSCYGYINAQGEIVIPFQYDEAGVFEDGYAKVSKNSREFLIDKSGREYGTRGPEGDGYVEIQEYSDGMCAVSTMDVSETGLAYHSDYECIAGKWGYLDEQGKEIIPPQYIFANPFVDGIAIVCKGEWTKSSKWDYEFHNGCYWSEEMLWGGINKKGEVVIPFVFEDIDHMVTDYDAIPIYRVIYGDKGNYKWGVIDNSGHFLTDSDTYFERIERDYSDGLIIFSEEYSEDELWGIYDTKRKEVLFQPQFLHVGFMGNGYIKVEVYDEKSGKDVIKIIDRTGKELFNSDYWSIIPFGPYLEVCRSLDGEKKWGLIDKEGNSILPCEYELIFELSKNAMDEGIIGYTQAGKCGICNLNGDVLLEPKYDNILRNCRHNLFIVQNRNQKGIRQEGIISDKGEMVLPMNYDSIRWVGDEYLLLNDKSGSFFLKYSEKHTIETE